MLDTNNIQQPAILSMESTPCGEIFASLNVKEFRKSKRTILIFDTLSVEIQKAGFKCQIYSSEKTNIPGHLLLQIWNSKKELSIEANVQLFHILLQLAENGFYFLESV